MTIRVASLYALQLKERKKERKPALPILPRIFEFLTLKSFDVCIVETNLPSVTHGVHKAKSVFYF